MEKVMGKLPNAPLAYTLAQVRFEQVLEMKNWIPQIQSALRSEFPRFREVPAISISFGQNGVMQQAGAVRWEFANAQNTVAVMLMTDSVILHATEYADFQWFYKKLEHVISALKKCIDGIWVNRVGLRYIDFILPRNSQEALSNYLKGSLGEMPNPGVSYSAVMTAQRMQFEIAPDKGAMLIQLHRGNGQPALPPDLGQHNLAESEIMKRAAKHNGECAVWDWDRFVEISTELNPKSLESIFNMLHSDITTAFKAFRTDFAFKVWSEKQ